MVIVLSRGSPGTICQWWNTERQKAWPCVGVLGDVASPPSQHCVDCTDTVGRRRHLDEEVRF